MSRHEGNHHPGHISRFDLAVYAALAIALLALLVGAAGYYRAQEQQSRQVVEAELDTIARLKVAQIAQWRAERLGDAGVLTSSAFFAEGVAQWLVSAQKADQDKILQRFEGMLQYGHYRAVVLVDTQGRVRLSAGAPSMLHSQEVQALAGALRDQRPVLIDLHAGPDDATPHLNLMAPILHKTGAGTTSIAAAILTINARDVLYPMLQSKQTASAETLLVRRDGDSALLLNDTRHQADTALRLRIPLTQVDAPIAMAVLGTEGVFRGVDYRGTQVLSVLHAIPDSPWFLVTKIEEAQALAQWRQRAFLITTLLVVLLLSCTGAVLMYGRQRETTQRLRSATRDLNKVNRAYRVLSECNQTLVHANDEQALLDRICSLLVEHGGYRCAWVGFAEHDAQQSVRLVAECGFEAGYVRSLHLSWSDSEQGRCPTGSAIGSGKCCVAHSADDRAAYPQWREGAQRHGYVSSISLPLTLDGAVAAALSIYSADAHAFEPKEVALLAEMASDLAFGIQTLRGNAARTLAQEALELERNKLSAAFQNVSIGLVMCDAQGGHITMNPAALKFHGFSSEKDMGQRLEDYTSDWELRYLDGRTMPLDEWPVARTLRGDCVSNYDTVLHQISTQFEMVCTYSSGLVRNSAGDVVLVVMTMLDISARVRAEQEVRSLNATLEQRVAERTAQLEEANLAKSDFLANMSHELRTPLNAVIGFSELLKDGVLGPLDAKQHEVVGDIFSAGSHLLSLINDILDLSKVEAGTLQLELVALDAPKLLQACTMIVREKAMAHGIRLATEIDPALGTLLADERKLKQIVYNLLSNAVKFTPKGGTVTLLARPCARADIGFDASMPSRLIELPLDADAAFLEIAVQDTGPGIAEADLNKLYQPFMQVDTSLARRHAGTGLGLSLVLRLAQAHAGTVGVASRVGSGSRFCVWLPYRDGLGTEPAMLDAQPAPPLALVIDNDDQAAEEVASRLRAEGFAVMRAATGEEALVRAAKRRPALITLDILLPAMDGWQFLRQLKAHSDLADTPVVIISLAPGLERGLALGAIRVLQKPFKPEELLATLSGLVPTQPHVEGETDGKDTGG